MKIYNTLTHKKEQFTPIKGKRVGLYTCGPTVYNFAHIGNFRAYITVDILQRTLKFLDYNVRWVMNITDVDDKTIRDSKKEFPRDEPMPALIKFTRRFEDIFWQDLRKLNIKKSDFYKNPSATETISEMQKLVIKIIDKAYAYIKDGSVYFNVKKYAKDYKYGQLLAIDMKEFRVGARIDVDEYEKENVQDFVLWKGKKDGEPSWNFEIDGKNYAGRPGWHIECSAMSNKFLGKKFDIHTGGVDLKFPHHENEIAQSTVGYGIPPVNFWLHNEHLLVDGGKMSKSKHNFYILSDLEKKGFSPLALRYLMLTANYRMPLNFTWKSLAGAQAALERLYKTVRELTHKNTPRLCSLNSVRDKSGQAKTQKHLSLVASAKRDENTKTRDDGRICKVYLKRFVSAISDDLDLPGALAVTWSLVKNPKKSDAVKLATLLEFDKVLGLGLADVRPVEIPAEIKKLARERDEARKNKDWKRADELRKMIEGEGFLIEDTNERTRISMKEK